MEELKKQLPDISLNLRDYLRNRLWYKPEESNYFSNSEQKSEFERIVNKLMNEIPVNGVINKNAILLSAYEKLAEQGIEERYISLILGLIDGGLEELKLINEQRSRAHEKLHLTLEELDREKKESADDPENVVDIEVDIRQIKFKLQRILNGTVEQIKKVIALNNADDNLRRKVQPFEGAFIRNELDYRPKNHSIIWPSFKKKAAKLFDLTENQVTAARAWDAKKLKKKGGKSVKDLIDELKSKVHGVNKPKNSKTRALEKAANTNQFEALPKVTSKTAEQNEIDDIYTFWPENSERRAYVKNLEPDKIRINSESIPNECKSWILAAVSLAPKEDKSKLRKIFAKLLGVSWQKVAGLTAYLSGKKREAVRNKKLLEAIEDVEAFLKGKKIIVEAKEESKLGESKGELKPYKTQEELKSNKTKSEISSDKAPIKSIDIDGATFDYDYEIKDAWRKKWFEFISERTSFQKRARMKVLCLPGRKCLEIPGYLELGFKPENIVGVEGDKSVQEEFTKNAKKYGIHPVCRRLEEVLPHLDFEFDVVSFDFTGPHSHKKESEILTQTLTSDNVLILTNYLAKREDKFSQATFQKSSRLFNDHASILRDRSFLPLPSVHDLTNDVLRENHEDEQQPLQSARENSTYFHIGNLGTNRKNPYEISFIRQSKLLNQASTESKMTLLLNVIQILTQFLKKYFPEITATRDMKITGLALNAMTVMATSYNYYIKDLSRYKYHNNSGSPFMSDFIHLTSTSPMASKCKKTINFILQLLLLFDKNEFSSANFVLRDKRGHEVSNRVARRSDIICFSYQDKYLELRIGSLNNDILGYKEFMTNFPLYTGENNIFVKPPPVKEIKL